MGGATRPPNPAAPSQVFTDAGELLNTTTIGHLALFNQHLQETNRKVEWVFSNGGDSLDNEYTDMGLSLEPAIISSKTTPVWYAKVMVDGEFHGRGRANTKKAAMDEAAKEGLHKLGIVV